MDSDPGQPKNPASAFQPLIDLVRREAIVEAEAEAERILTNAQDQAAKIVASAKEEAGELLDEARQEARQFEDSARESLKRASRDVLLSVESALVAQLEAALARESAEAMQGEGLATILGKIAENWRKDDPDADLEALLSPDDLEALQAAAERGVARQLLAGVTLKPSPKVSAGVQIGRKDGSVHYDFTAQTLAEWLGRVTGPRLREILREAAEEAESGS